MRIGHKGLMWVAAAGAAIVLITALAVIVPRAIRERDRRMTGQCQVNLTRIDGAKEQWALENNQYPGRPVRKEDLWKADGSGYLHAWPRWPPIEWPKCPKGYPYKINEVGEDPECTSGLPGHTIEITGCGDLLPL